MSDAAKRSFGSPAKSGKKDVVVDLPAARRMLPLVMSIVRDIVDSQDALTRLTPEEERLERQRRELDWTERQRRYLLQDEIVAAQGALKKAVTELKELGLALLDESEGRVAFPTKVNGRPAVFTWQPGEDSVQFWSYEGEDMRRPIPGEWSNRPQGKP